MLLQGRRAWWKGLWAALLFGCVCGCSVDRVVWAGGPANATEREQVDAVAPARGAFADFLRHAEQPCGCMYPGRPGVRAISMT